MQIVPQRRSRVAAGNALPKQDVSFGELRQQMLQAARAHGISNTAYRVLDALFSRAGLQPDRRRNGVTVLRHWVREDGCHTLLVWPSEAWLAETVGCHPRTIRRAIRELREAGLIEREHRAGGTPGRRNGANLDSLTRLIVPTPERMPKPRLRFNGSAEELAAAARAGDPKARTMLVDAATALAEWTRDAIDEQTRGMVEGVDRRTRDVLAVIGSTIEGVTVGFYAGLPKAASDGVTLLTGVDEQAAPKASNGEDLRQNGEDKSVRTVRTNLSSPSELSHLNSFKPNQTDAIENAQPVAGKDEVGLVRFAEPEADPSDPAYRVESDETADTRVEEHGWGESGPELSDLRPWMVEEAVAAYPNLAAYRHESKTMLNAFRKARGYPPRCTNRNVERMVEIGMRRTDAEGIAREYESQPDALRDMIDALRAEAREGGIENPAGLLRYRLTQAKAKRSGGYSVTQ